MDERSGGAVLSVLGRWDFHVTDLGPVLAAGRAAYRMNHPDHPGEADAAVTGPEEAAEQLLEAYGVDAVFDTEGLRPVRIFTAALTHDEDDDDRFDEDPFAIAYEDVD